MDLLLEADDKFAVRCHQRLLGFDLRHDCALCGEGGEQGSEFGGGLGLQLFRRVRLTNVGTIGHRPALAIAGVELALQLPEIGVGLVL